jgi:hypothetical protein
MKVGQAVSRFCRQANAWHFNSIVKDTKLYDTPCTPCR